MKSEPMLRWLRRASVLALVGLAFMIWSLIDPRPAPVVLGLSVGQGIGTLSFLVFVVVVVVDLRRRSGGIIPDGGSSPPSAPK